MKLLKMNYSCRIINILAAINLRNLGAIYKIGITMNNPQTTNMITTVGMNDKHFLAKDHIYILLSYIFIRFRKKFSYNK